MKSLSITWTDTVEDMEVRFGLDAIQGIVGELHTVSFRKGWFQAPPTVNVFGNWIIPGLPEDAPYRSLQWYITQSYDPHRQRVIGSKFLDLVLNEPWQKSDPHYDLTMIGYGLLPTQEHAPDQQALALSVPGRATVISTVPLRRIADERLRLCAIRRVAGHQLGHLFGIPRPSRPNTVEDPSGEWHCLNFCIMRESQNLQELLTMALDEFQAHVLLCPACWQDLFRVMMDDYVGLS